MMLRTVVLMKTDIAGSTPRFRALLAADHQSLLSEHRAVLARHAGDHGGHIIKSAGDGYWLEYPSATAAAKSAIAMLEALRLGQSNKGDDRLSMRVVIGLGDVATLDGELIGDLLALIVRIEAITPADEIYLTLTARHALAQAEMQTAIVDNFPLKGFPDPILCIVSSSGTAPMSLPMPTFFLPTCEVSPGSPKSSRLQSLNGCLTHSMRWCTRWQTNLRAQSASAWATATA
jgi:class 3 adenylate cyclase